MPEAAIGRIVIFTERVAGNITVYPAIITKVWSATVVNLQVFRDADVDSRSSVELRTDWQSEYRWSWPVIA